MAPFPTSANRGTVEQSRRRSRWLRSNWLRSDAARRERVEPQLRVVGLATPAVLVLRPVVYQEQQPGYRQALDQAIEQHLRLGIDPVSGRYPFNGVR